MNHDDEKIWFRGQRARLLMLVDEIGRQNPDRLRQLRPAIEKALDDRIAVIFAQNITVAERKSRIRAMITEAMRTLQPVPPSPPPPPRLTHPDDLPIILQPAHAETMHELMNAEAVYELMHHDHIHTDRHDTPELPQ